MKKEDLKEFMSLCDELELQGNYDVTKLEQVSDNLEQLGLMIMSDVVEEGETAENMEAIKEMNVKGKIMRGIGQKFFNLFKVTLTVSFAGVTLIHFTIPKQK